MASLLCSDKRLFTCYLITASIGLVSAVSWYGSLSCNTVCSVDPSSNTADCSDRSLSTVPMCHSIETLNLQRNNFINIKAETFGRFKSLKSLDISRCNVSFIERGAFAGTIRRLYLNGNNISQIEGDIFGDMSPLRVLNLAENFMSSAGNGAFISLGNLVKLSLANNLITGLDAGTFVGLKSVTTLLLSRNYIGTVHRDAFRPMPKLQRLYLGVNRIASLHMDTFSKLHKLGSLSLAANRLIRIPPAILGIKSLKRLDLQDNRIGEVSPIVPLLGRITDLYLNGNPIQCEECPVEFAAWEQIEQPESQTECFLKDGTKVKVSNLVSIETNVPADVLSTTPEILPSTSHALVESTGDLMRVALFILVPAAFIILIGTISFLEHQTRARLARKGEEVGDTDKLHRLFTPYRDADDCRVNEATTSEQFQMKAFHD